MNSLLQVLSDVYCPYVWVIRVEHVTASREAVPAVCDVPTHGENCFATNATFKINFF
jgi:hypothetical protein